MKLLDKPDKLGDYQIYKDGRLLYNTTVISISRENCVIKVLWGEVTIEYGVEEGRLILTFKGGKKKRTFRLPLLDLGEGLEREPKIEYKNSVVINADALREVLKDAKLVSTHITLIADEKKFRVEIKGDDGEISEEFEKDGVALKELKVGAPAKATYPLSYMEDMIKAAKSETDITIYLENDRPLKMEYAVAGAEAKYYLAPRIESA